MTLIYNIVRERLFLPAIRVSAAHCQKRVEREGEKEREVPGSIGSGYMALSCGNAFVNRWKPHVGRLPRRYIVTTHAEFRKRARLDYVYPMIQRYSADRRPRISHSIRRTRERTSERASERAIDSRVLETNKHYANRSLIYLFRPGVRDPRFPQCQEKADVLDAFNFKCVLLD